MTIAEFSTGARPVPSMSVPPRTCKGLSMCDDPSCSMAFERQQRPHRNVELAQLVGAAEVRQIDDEAGGEHLGPHLAEQLDGALGRAAGGDEVIDDDHP